MPDQFRRRGPDDDVREFTTAQLRKVIEDLEAVERGEIDALRLESDDLQCATIVICLKK